MKSCKTLTFESVHGNKVLPAVNFRLLHALLGGILVDGEGFLRASEGVEAAEQVDGRVSAGHETRRDDGQGERGSQDCRLHHARLGRQHVVAHHVLGRTIETENKRSLTLHHIQRNSDETSLSFVLSHEDPSLQGSDAIKLQNQLTFSLFKNVTREEIFICFEIIYFRKPFDIPKIKRAAKLKACRFPYNYLKAKIG